MPAQAFYKGTFFNAPIIYDRVLDGLKKVDDVALERISFLTRYLYSQQIKRYHPDLGGDEEKTKLINNAWAILSDEKKKNLDVVLGDIRDPFCVKNVKAFSEFLGECGGFEIC